MGGKAHPSGTVVTALGNVVVVVVIVVVVSTKAHVTNGTVVAPGTTGTVVVALHGMRGTDVVVVDDVVVVAPDTDEGIETRENPATTAHTMTNRRIHHTLATKETPRWSCHQRY